MASRGACGTPTHLQTLLPEGVQWFRDGEFIALLGDDEDRVVRAWAACRAAAEWSATPLAGIDPNDPAWLTRAPSETHVVLDRPARGSALDACVRRRCADGREAPAATDASTVAFRHEATYTRPYLAHASIGPSCALANPVDGQLEVWCHSQAIFALQAEIAGALGLPLERVTVHHVQGAGCYGHNGADDAAFDAALLAWRLQQPVRVQWMREDEFSSAPFGPATVVKIAASIDARGRIGDWQFDSWGAGHHSRPGTPAAPRLLARLAARASRRRDDARQPADVVPAAAPSATRFRSTRSTASRSGSIASSRRRCARRRCARSVRSPTCSRSSRSSTSWPSAPASIRCSCASITCAMSAPPTCCAMRSRARRGRRGAPRRRRTTASAARSPATRAAPAGARWSRACRPKRKIAVHDLYVSVDVGTVVNPDGVRSQVEGGAVQATSWALTERLGFDAAGVATATWDSYPILRFSDAPAVHVNVLDRAGEPALGAGEIAQGPTAAAIANALAHALGVRVRDLPMTFDRVAQAIGA